MVTQGIVCASPRNRNMLLKKFNSPDLRPPAYTVQVGSTYAFSKSIAKTDCLLWKWMPNDKGWHALFFAAQSSRRGGRPWRPQRTGTIRHTKVYMTVTFGVYPIPMSPALLALRHLLDKGEVRMNSQTVINKPAFTLFLQHHLSPKVCSNHQGEKGVTFFLIHVSTWIYI